MAVEEPRERTMMARNCCGGGLGCGCKVSPGEGISISGSGTASDPFVISSEITSFAAAFIAVDTPTVDMSLVGGGTEGDPFILSAESSMSMTQLSDWDDPSGPAIGEVPVWNGVAWEAAAPPTVPPGYVNADTGLTGDGTLAAPLKVRVSTTSTTSLSGLATYIDSAGQIRVVAPTATAVLWNDIQEKPSAYPNATRVGGHLIFVQSATPTTGMVLDDLWVKKP